MLCAGNRVKKTKSKIFKHRDWSLITGRGGYKMGKTFRAPLLKNGNFTCPPLQYG